MTHRLVRDRAGLTTKGQEVFDDQMFPCRDNINSLEFNLSFHVVIVVDLQFYSALGEIDPEHCNLNPVS